jgi:hypothetical protein
MGFFLPGWGMHLIDLNAPQGDLLRRISALNGTATPTRVQTR